MANAEPTGKLSRAAADEVSGEVMIGRMLGHYRFESKLGIRARYR